MSTAFPTIEGSEVSPLADEISDVIEEHGRGLDSDHISSALEEVAAELEHRAPTNEPRRELKRELRSFVRKHASDLDRDELRAMIHGIAEDLRGGSLIPDVQLRAVGPPHALAFVFDSAFALRYQIPKILDSRGYFVEADAPFTHLDDIRVAVETTLLTTSVPLVGSVVRTAPNGFAVRLTPESPSAHRRLDELPTNHRRARSARSS